MSILRHSLPAIAALAFSCSAAAAPMYSSVAAPGRASPLLTPPDDAHTWSGDALQQVFERVDAASTGTSGARTPRVLESAVSATGGTPRQSIPAQRNPLSVNLRGDSDLFLWNLVALVHAQQVNRTFDLVDTNLTAFLPATHVVSQVPLPGALWLLGAGLAGLMAAARRRLGLRRLAIGALAPA